MKATEMPYATLDTFFSQEQAAPGPALPPQDQAYAADATAAEIAYTEALRAWRTRYDRIADKPAFTAADMQTPAYREAVALDLMRQALALPGNRSRNTYPTAATAPSDTLWVGFSLADASHGSR